MTRYILIISFLILLSSCSSDNISTSPIEKKPTPGLFSKDAEKGVSLNDIVSGKKSDGINVNGYLWRASLNILSIAPLISTDALGGTIITDWYVNKNIQNHFELFLKSTNTICYVDFQAHYFITKYYLFH